MLRTMLATVVLLGSVVTVAAQPQPGNPADKSLVTKVYDLKPILDGKVKTIGVTDSDGVIKLIVENIRLGDVKPGTDGTQIIDRDGGRLEVRANAKVQEEISDLIDAITRLSDLAVDVTAEVIEFDMAGFEKLSKALSKVSFKTKSPVLLATGEEFEDEARAPALEKELADVNKVLNEGKVIQWSTNRFLNGSNATFSARRSILTYHNRPDPGWFPIPGNTTSDPQYVKEGFALVGMPVVSSDRRFVRFKLTEQSVKVAGMRKRDLGEIGGQKVIAQTPELEDLGATGSAVVSDVGTLLFRLTYAPKDKVWVVMLQPRIFIPAEEDELKKQQKK